MVWQRETLKCLLAATLSGFCVSSSAQTGKVGINTQTPQAMLHVKDSSVLFSGGLAPAQTAGNLPGSGSGIRMMWYPDKAAFRSGYFDGSIWTKDGIGDYSFAVGVNPIALGYASTAMGFATVASGSTSTSLGLSSVASGTTSTALGYQTAAGGFVSTALGYVTKANGYATLSIGMYNDTVVAPQISVNPTTPLFIIGNGSVDNRSNAMVVRKDGRVGIGTNFPSARLHVQDSSVLFSGGMAPAQSPGDLPGSGSGIRMMWYPDKAVFRSGYFDGTIWTKDGIGDYSFAVGVNPIALGYASTAMGFATVASGSTSTSLGLSSVASGTTSTALGYQTAAGGFVSTALGYVTKANGYATLSIGMYNDTIVGPQISVNPTTPLFIIGNGSSTNRSNAMVVRKDGHVGIGTNIPEERIHVHNPVGNVAIRINSPDGDTAAIKIFESTGFGFEFQYAGSDDKFHLWSRKFVGNEGIRMTWLKNGNVGIGTTSPSAKLHVEGNICYTGTIGACSDRRYKKNFTELNNILSKLDGIDAYAYAWDTEAFPDRAFTDDCQIGVIAQEVQAVFPEIVLTDADGFLSVDYSRLSVILLAGMKEQQSHLIKQQEEITALQNEIAQLKSLVHSMISNAPLQAHDTR